MLFLLTIWSIYLTTPKYLKMSTIQKKVLIIFFVLIYLLSILDILNGWSLLIK